MALNEDAVVVAAQGYVYINSIGATAPTPAEVDSLDPDTYGAQKHNIVVTGNPTSFTLVVDGYSTDAITVADISTDDVRDAIEAVTGVGVGNVKVKVEGTNTIALGGFDVYFTADLLGSTVTLAEGTFVGGSTPNTAVTTTAPNGWINIGHTSRSDLPEWGFEGGKTKLKGSWQKKRLREVEDGEPVEDSVTLSLVQWDEVAMELYFGADASDVEGVYGVSGDFHPVEKGFLVILVDGDARVGFYATKASIQRDAAIKLPLDDLASLPIKATFLNYGSRRLYDWISAEHFSFSSTGSGS